MSQKNVQPFKLFISTACDSVNLIYHLSLKKRTPSISSCMLNALKTISQHFCFHMIVIEHLISRCSICSIQAMLSYTIWRNVHWLWSFFLHALLLSPLLYIRFIERHDFYRNDYRCFFLSLGAATAVLMAKKVFAHYVIAHYHYHNKFDGISFSL